MTTKKAQSKRSVRDQNTSVAKSTAVRKSAGPDKEKEAKGSPKAVKTGSSTLTIQHTAHSVLGLKSRIKPETVLEGFSVEVIDTLATRLEEPAKKTLDILGLSRSTIARQRKTGRLTANQSDRVYRFAELFARATDLLGSESAAVHWLKSPAIALSNETPLGHASTEVGAREVINLIGRLEHGIPA